jgi:hypothetical protein
LQITRYPSVDENETLACLSAFVDSLTGEMNAALMYLRKLEGQRKGSAFAYEMQFDRHRYGAIIVLERWGEFLRVFAEHAQPRFRTMFEEGPRRVESSAALLARANAVLDAAPEYSSDLVAACALAAQTVIRTFEEERAAAEKALSLGPMLPQEFHDVRRVFLADLAAR